MSKAAERRAGRSAKPPRPIGFRGRHDHGKPLDDPVYPSKHVPAALLPQFPADWRSAGRALLCIGMAALEGFRMRSKGRVMKWQAAGFCSPTCSEQCAKSPNRILCAWRVQNTVHEHHNYMDGLLNSYKGVVNYHNNLKPIFRVQRQVALRNPFLSERMLWEASTARYVFADREPIHPAFGISHDQRTQLGEVDETAYVASDDEGETTDEDSDGDGCA